MGSEDENPFAKVDKDKRHELLVLISSLSPKFYALAFSYLSTRDKIKSFENIRWYEEGMERGEAKHRMKTLGGSIFQYQEILYESYVMLLAKAMEDTAIELRLSSARLSFHPHKNNHDVLFKREVQAVSAMSNVIKHNRSLIVRKSSESSKFLVDECGVRDETPIVDLSRYYGNLFSITYLIPKCYIAAYDLVRMCFDFESPVLKCDFRDAAKMFYEMAIPEVLGIDLPDVAD